MLNQKSNALEVIRITLGKITEVKKPLAKLVIHTIELWLGMNCRYVFTNMERWGRMSEKSYRNGFKKLFDWFGFNLELVQKYCSSGRLIAVFDPSFIGKSGKETYGLSMFWSSIGQRMLRGIEAGCLAFIDTDNATAMHGIAVQTPSVQSLKQTGKTLVNHYRSIIETYLEKILKVTSYLAVDGYFMKKDFIWPLLEKGLHIITKARPDANLRYLYKGKQRTGKGRRRCYDGKVDTTNIDKRRIKFCGKDKDKTVHAAVLYCVQLKRPVLVCFVYYAWKQQPEIIIGTDTEMDGLTLCHYYGLRFQIEFLIRDAKQYAGMDDCQARDEQKLHMHFNMSLTTVSVAKAAYYLSGAKEQRGSFSMADIKMLHMNQLITKRIFSNLAIDLNCKKIKRIYNQCLNFGRLRA